MKHFWNRDELSRELRAARPKPPAELESALDHRIEAERRSSRGRLPSFRLGFAAATTALLVASFAAAGGMAAASSSVRHALTDVAQAVHLSSPTTHAKAASAPSPATDQYGRKKNCVKSASDRRHAAIHAADAKLHRSLALAGKAYKRRVSNARKLAAAKQHAALRAAYGKYLHGRAVAYRQHASVVKKANARYRLDAKKCPVT